MNPSPATTTTSASSSSTTHRIALAHVGAGRGRVRGEPPHPARRAEALRRAGGGSRRGRGGRAAERASSTHSTANPSSRSASCSRRSASRSASSNASRRLPTRRNASPASSSRRSSDRSVSSMHEPGALRAQQPARLVVRRRGTAQREAAVAAAGSARDLARLVEAHAHAALGERERTRAARHAAADHRHLGATVEAAPRELARAAPRASMKLCSRRQRLRRRHHLPVQPVRLRDEPEQLQLGECGRELTGRRGPCGESTRRLRPARRRRPPGLLGRRPGQHRRLGSAEAARPRSRPARRPRR